MFPKIGPCHSVAFEKRISDCRNNTVVAEDPNSCLARPAMDQTLNTSSAKQVVRVEFQLVATGLQMYIII